MLMSKDSVLSSLPEVVFPIPAYMRDAVQQYYQEVTYRHGAFGRTVSRWRSRLTVATYVNVKELDKVGPVLKIMFVSWDTKLRLTELMYNSFFMECNRSGNMYIPIILLSHQITA